MSDTIKSITTVQQRHGGEWVVRVRMQDGSEKFLGVGAGYTMHQAQTYESSIRRDIARHGLSVLDAA